MTRVVRPDVRSPVGSPLLNDLQLPLDKWFAYMAQNGLALKDTDIIIVAEMPYVKQLGAVLKKYSAR